MTHEEEELVLNAQLAKGQSSQHIQAALDALKKSEPDWSKAAEEVQAALDTLKGYEYGYAQPGYQYGYANFTDDAKIAQQAIQDKNLEKAIAALESIARSAQAGPTDQPVNGQARLTADLRTGQAGEYEIVIMDAGQGNGWEWPVDVLRRDLAVFNGVTSFLDHELANVQEQRPGGRTTRDICGVISNPHWSEAERAIVATWSPRRPQGQLAVAIVEDYLADKMASRPTTNIGISADISFTHVNKRVTQLAKAHSVDVVYNPARGGRFVRAILAQELPMTQPKSQQNTPDPQPMLKRMATVLLDKMLEEAKLPQVASNHVRVQFANVDVLPIDQVETAIAAEREYLGLLIEDKTITGLTRHDDQRPTAARLGGSLFKFTPTSDPIDRIRLALSRWFGAPLPAGVVANSVPRIDIGELYADLTGDVNLQGRWDIPHAIERTGLANITDTTFNNVVADSMNVVILYEWDVIAAAGYEWWRKIAHEEDFDSIHEVEWTTIGGFGNLDKINPGQAVPELAITDLDTSEDTDDWAMAAGMISVPIQTFDKGAKRGAFKSLPTKLGVAALRTLSTDVGAIFTSNAGVGPALADNVALFNWASHANLRTTALSPAAWEEVIKDQWKQTEQNSSKMLAIRPTLLLVPIELESLGRRIVGGDRRQGIADNDIVPQGYGLPQENVIACPEFTDANDWATVADPRVYPSIGIGYRFGRKPEVIAEPGGMASQGMFIYNVLRWKAQWLYVVSVITHRGLQKRNVA